MIHIVQPESIKQDKMTFRDWLHHLFNPHCEFCEARPKCASCEILKDQLEHANFEKEMLLKSILQKPEQIQQNEIAEDITPIQSRNVPWEVKRRMLEAEDRARADIIRKQKADQVGAIAELERSV